MNDKDTGPVISIAREPRKIRKKLGRPFGASSKNIKHKQVLDVLSVESRLRILAEIANNNDGTARPAERINAVKLITDILNDKVQIKTDNEADKKYILEFANHVNNKDNKIIDENKEQVDKLKEELKDDSKKIEAINKNLNAAEVIEELKDIADNRGMSLNLYSTSVINEVDTIEDKNRDKFVAEECPEDILDDEDF
jgi:hypothetical protein